jgi:hypothetical protein
MAKLMTVHQRRKADRERLKRWRKNKLAEGNKHIHLMLTPEAQEVLKHEKAQTGEPYVRIINRAIVGLKESRSKLTTSRTEREREQESIREVILKMDKDGKNHSHISKHLNDEDRPTTSGKRQWFSETVRNNLKREE